MGVEAGDLKLMTRGLTFGLLVASVILSFVIDEGPLLQALVVGVCLGWASGFVEGRSSK